MGELVEDGAECKDYLMDLRFFNSKKKRMEYPNGVELEVSDADSDYLNLLNGEEPCGSKKKSNEIEVEESSVDTDYGKFLRSEELWFYEHDQDSEKEEWRQKSLDHHNGTHMEESSVDSDYAKFMRGEEQCFYEHDDQDPQERMDPMHELFFNNIQKECKSFSSEIPSNSDPEEEDEWDSQYELFLNNVKVDGQLFSYEVPTGSGVSVYRFEECSSEEVEIKITSMTDSRSAKAKVPEKKAGAAKKVSKIGDEGSKNIVRGAQFEMAANVEEIKVEYEDENDFMHCKSSGEPSKNVNCVIRDERYDKLWNSLANCGKKMVFSQESYHKSSHQKDNESHSDLEILATDHIPFHEGGYTPFVPSKCYQSLPGEESCEVIENSSRSLFREKLINLLKKPYDENEFQYLWKEVTDRKPVQRTHELRGRIIVYSTKADGKSYLDWYNKLRVKIDEGRPDKRKILHLLRGFFFWLESQWIKEIDLGTGRRAVFGALDLKEIKESMDNEG